MMLYKIQTSSTLTSGELEIKSLTKYPAGATKYEKR